MVIKILKRGGGINFSGILQTVQTVVKINLFLMLMVRDGVIFLWLSP